MRCYNLLMMVMMCHRDDMVEVSLDGCVETEINNRN